MITYEAVGVVAITNNEFGTVAIIGEDAIGGAVKSRYFSSQQTYNRIKSINLRCLEKGVKFMSTLKCGYTDEDKETRCHFREGFSDANSELNNRIPRLWF